MDHTIRDRKALTTRIRRIEGQLQSLKTALDGNHDCGAVLQQIAAVRGAVNGLMAEVLEGHLREHLMPSAAGHDDDLEQVVRVLRSYLR